MTGEFVPPLNEKGDVKLMTFDGKATPLPYVAVHTKAALAV